MLMFSMGCIYGLLSKSGMFDTSSCVNTDEKNAFIKFALSLGSVGYALLRLSDSQFFFLS